MENDTQIWKTYADRITWFEPWKTLKEVSFHKPVSIQWYLGGKVNVSYNCIDRHLEKNGDKTALIFEPDQPNDPSLKITYKELYHHVCRFANLMKKYQVKKGDRVTIYMPMIPEAVYAMLACTRIGAVHSVVFGGFSAESLAGRIQDCESEFIITANVGLRGGKEIPLKKNVDEAILLAEKMGHKIRNTVVVERTPAAWDKKPNDITYATEIKSMADTCNYEIMDSEDPLFILYTSGSTGKPKGVLHTTGGYLTYVSATHESVFNYQPGDIYWCTADVGWVTGHSYIVYGPLSNAATSLIFEGVPNYPTPSRFWQVIDKHQVNIFYTAPTAVRALMREDLKYVNEAKLTSLKLLGSVGEPINPEAWIWYHKNIGKEKCPIVDTWWQTETGGILISPEAKSDRIKQKQKPGSATRPLPGIKTEVLDANGKTLSGACEGVLAIKDSWPGQMRTVYKDHKRFEETYFSTFAGYYFTGDGCRRDEDGDYWITGRVDDVINVSGHRIGTAEVESALVANLSVAEAAVVGFPHDLKGQGIYAYVTLKNGVTASDQLKQELVQTVRKQIGPIASPDKIQWAPGLPKTRSGKIMRRILRKIAENQMDQLGDISTLADPSVVEQLKANRI